MGLPEKAARAHRRSSTYIEGYWLCLDIFSAVNEVVYAQIRDLIHWGLTRWPVTVPIETVRQSGRVEWSPVNKHQVQSG